MFFFLPSLLPSLPPQLRGLGRRRREAEHLGLEDHQAVPPHQGPRQGVHQRPVAPARDVQGHHLRLGRTDQTLGLGLTCRRRLEVKVVEVKGGFRSSTMDLIFSFFFSLFSTGCPRTSKVSPAMDTVESAGLVSSLGTAVYFCTPRWERVVMRLRHSHRKMFISTLIILNKCFCPFYWLLSMCVCVCLCPLLNSDKW